MPGLGADVVTVTGPTLASIGLGLGGKIVFDDHGENVPIAFNIVKGYIYLIGAWRETMNRFQEAERMVEIQCHECGRFFDDELNQGTFNAPQCPDCCDIQDLTEQIEYLTETMNDDGEDIETAGYAAFELVGKRRLLNTLLAHTGRI